MNIGTGVRQRRFGEPEPGRRKAQASDETTTPFAHFLTLFMVFNLELGTTKTLDAIERGLYT
jgi:hypothetical protein